MNHGDQRVAHFEIFIYVFDVNVLDFEIIIDVTYVFCTELINTKIIKILMMPIFREQPTI